MWILTNALLDYIFFLYLLWDQELSNSSPLHTEPKTHVEEEEMPEDEQREFKLPRDVAEDDPVLGQPRS